MWNSSVFVLAWWATRQLCPESISFAGLEQDGLWRFVCSFQGEFNCGAFLVKLNSLFCSPFAVLTSDLQARSTECQSNASYLISYWPRSCEGWLLISPTETTAATRLPSSPGRLYQGRTAKLEEWVSSCARRSQENSECAVGYRSVFGSHRSEYWHCRIHHRFDCFSLDAKLSL